jgi:replicative DNA helicase
MDILFDVSNISEYAKMVKSASIGRNLKHLGRKLMNDNIEPERRLDIGFSDLTEINKSASYGRKVAAGEVSANILSTIIGGNGFNSGVKTGFLGLDAPLNGLQRQSYYILGARPSIGKSALALQISRNVAATGKSVLYISPEMSKDQLVIRLLSMESGVPYDDIIKNTEMKEDDKDALIAANGLIKSLPLFIDDASEQSVSNIRLKSRQQSGDGLSLLVIDYLQLLCPEDDDKASVTKVSKGLKAIAKDLNIPVLVCSQLRRRYGQEPSRPDSSRLRGSGQIEQDADAIMLMHPVNDNHSKMEVFLDKHRNGPLGQVVLDFNRQTTKFTETDVW